MSTGGFDRAFPGGRVEWEIKLEVNKKINPESMDSTWVNYSGLESILSDIESAIEMGKLKQGKPVGEYFRIGGHNTVSYNVLPNKSYWIGDLRFPVLVEDYDFVVTERLTDTMKIFLIGPIFIHNHDLCGPTSRHGYNYHVESKKVLKYWGEPVGAFLQWNTGSSEVSENPTHYL